MLGVKEESQGDNERPGSDLVSGKRNRSIYGAILHCTDRVIYLRNRGAISG